MTDLMRDVKISKANDYHQEAMRLAEEALITKQEYLSLLRCAYSNAKAAADFIASEIDLEPTRSVLLRSAASLAIECGEFYEAKRLIQVGLSGNPPEEIADELLDLTTQIPLAK